MQNAKNDLNAYDKANEFLLLLVDAAADRSNYILRKSAASIAGDREFMAVLWQGVTSRHIQFRMLESYLSNREALLQIGVQEDDLPLSPELAKAKETASATEFEQDKSEEGLADDSDLSVFDDDDNHE